MHSQRDVHALHRPDRRGAIKEALCLAAEALSVQHGNNIPMAPSTAAQETGFLWSFTHGCMRSMMCTIRICTIKVLRTQIHTYWLPENVILKTIHPGVHKVV